MANYRTCHNCAHDRTECATLDNLKRSIAGLSVTSIKFRCSNRLPRFQPGQRVSVTWPVSDGGDGEYYEYTLETWPATVIEEVGARFVICVDDVDSDFGTPARSYLKNSTLYAKVSATKLAPLDEPRKPVCRLCGIVAGNGYGDCWQTGTAPSRQCLRGIQGEAA